MVSSFAVVSSSDWRSGADATLEGNAELLKARNSTHIVFKAHLPPLLDGVGWLASFKSWKAGKSGKAEKYVQDSGRVDDQRCHPAPADCCCKPSFSLVKLG